MVTATDAESSSRRRVAQSLGAHVAILEAMIARMRAERDALPADDLYDRIILDNCIQNVERDLRAIRFKLL